MCVGNTSFTWNEPSNSCSWISHHAFNQRNSQRNSRCFSNLRDVVRYPTYPFFGRLKYTMMSLRTWNCNGKQPRFHDGLWFTPEVIARRCVLLMWATHVSYTHQTAICQYEPPTRPASWDWCFMQELHHWGSVKIPMPMKDFMVVTCIGE